MYQNKDLRIEPKFSTLKTVLGVPVALAIWAIVYFGIYWLIYLLDVTRGLDDDWLQSVFREWVAPGIGAFAAIAAVDNALAGANLKAVALFFCLPIVILFIGVSLFLILEHGDKYDYSIAEQIMQWGVAVSTCIGAYVGQNKFSGEDR